MDLLQSNALAHYRQLAPHVKKRDTAAHLKNMMDLVRSLETQLVQERAVAAQHIGKLNCALALRGVSPGNNTVFRDALLQNSILEKELLHAYGTK